MADRQQRDPIRYTIALPQTIRDRKRNARGQRKSRQPSNNPKKRLDHWPPKLTARISHSGCLTICVVTQPHSRTSRNAHSTTPRTFTTVREMEKTQTKGGQLNERP